MQKGEVRSSQLLTTFGPGAMIDLPDGAVIVGGLENWNYKAGRPRPYVEEPRLIAKLRNRLGKPALKLQLPPASDDNEQGSKPGITVWRFPRWFLVQKPEQVLNVDGKPLPGYKGTRRRLVHQSRLIKNRFKDGSESYDVVPVRFVRACAHGHVDDIEWSAFVHGHGNHCGGDLFLDEKSTTGALVDIEVACSCGLRRSLAQAAVKGSRALGLCSAARPWIGSYSNDPLGCKEYSRLLIRSASNAYFSQTLSVISIPDRKSPVDEIVRQLWDQGMSTVAAQPATLAVIRTIPNIAARLAGIQDAEILASAARIAAGVEVFVERPVKDAEFEAFSDSADEAGSDKPDGDFYARRLPLSQWQAAWMSSIRSVIMVHRLREVISQVGFTRFESAATQINGELPDELSLDVQVAPLADDVEWLPAVENRGEGVFLVFDEKQISNWVETAAVQTRLRLLKKGYAEWLRTHPTSKRTFPGGAYYLLHTFAHLLMTSISLDCGYPASSLRERIYCSPEDNSKPGQYGVLVFTGSSDAEGTLGGLIEAARRIRYFVRKALELGGLCSNDPICAHHSPGEHDHAPLNGAACHGCLLVPETSCEQRNEFLDRALVVATVENARAEFFTLP
jgi:hypothetical protein